MENKDFYLRILSQKGKSLRPLKDQFYELGGFYDGIAYVFPSASEPMITPIVNCLGLNLIKTSLGSGQTFEQLKQSHKIVFFRDKLFKAEEKLLLYKETLKIDEISEEKLLSLSEHEHETEAALELHYECERLRAAIQWAEKTEEALKTGFRKSAELRFISEMSPNYFVEPPSEKPRLLYFVGNDGSKSTFLHKEITSMLVAEGGRGKTHLLALLGASVATGIPFLGQIEVEKPGAVCFVVGENDYGDIHRLLFKTYPHLENILKVNGARKDGKHFGCHFENPLEHLSSNFMPVSVHGLNAHFETVA